MNPFDQNKTDTNRAQGFEALAPDEIQRIEKILGNPRDGEVRGSFDPATGALAGEAPLVPVDARQIASVTSIRTHGN